MPLATQRYLPARELIDAWLEGRRDPSTLDRLRQSLSPEDVVRVAWMYPADGFGVDRLALLDRVLGDRLTEALRTVMSLRARTPLGRADADRLRELLRDVDPDALEARLARHLLARATMGRRDDESKSHEVAMARSAHRAGDTFMRVLVRLQRIERLLDAGKPGQARRACDRAQDLARDADGADILEPCLAYFEARVQQRLGDPDALWTFLALRKDFRLLDHLRDACSLRACDILTERNQSASALAIQLDLAHRPPRPGEQFKRGHLLLGLAENLALSGDVDFALRHIDECINVLSHEGDRNGALTKAHALRSALLSRRQEYDEARSALDLASELMAGSPHRDLELLLLLQYARALMLEGAGRDEEALELTADVLSGVDRTASLGRWAALLALVRLRLLKERGKERAVLLDAINDTIFFAARANDIVGLREGYFNLALTQATSGADASAAIEACREAERLTRASLDSLRADRDMLFRLLPPDTVMRTVLSSLIGRLVEDAERGLDDLFELSTTLVEQARHSQVIVEELERSQRQVNRVLGSLPVIIWTSDGRARDFQCRHIDGAVEQIYGRAQHEFTASPGLWLDLIEDRDRGRVVAALREVEARLEGMTVVFRIPGGQEAARWIEARIMPILGEDHVDGALYGIMTDVTERRELEQHLHQAQKMDAVGRLAGGIAHDFNNVLSGILGAATLLANSAGEDDRQRRLVGAIEKSALRGADITARIKEFARKAPATPRLVDLTTLARETTEMVHHLVGRSIEVVFSGTERPRMAMVPPAAITQALINLIVNAADAEPRDGRVTVTVEDGEDGRPRILVTDRGVGMDEELRRHALDPFFTTKGRAGERVGLGLTIVYRIVSECEGEMDIDSRRDQGTTVTLTFPRVAEAARPAAGDAAASPHRFEGRLLLIDDNEESRTVDAMILESAGFEVVTAADGLDGLAIWEQDPGSFALIVTDLRMPRCDGFGVVREIRAHSKQPPILLTTGYADEEPEEFAAAWPNVACIRKPFTANRFLEMAWRLVGDDAVR